MSELLKELETAINRHSVENESNTPDWILAEYLRGCLTVFAETIKKRDKWWSHETFGGYEKVREVEE